jgi:pSer/pThr/pTyr-binding forkhead associated (FHA) protein
VPDRIISRFAEACGATRPIDLQVDLADGGRLAVGSVPMPFILVGRDDGCDVTLTDSEVNPRHAWLQVVGGRVLAIDLGSRMGLRWSDERTGSGWFDASTPVQIGPFRLQLQSPVTDRQTPFPPGYNPLQSDRVAMRALPSSVLEFRNGKRAKDRWTVNRLVTLVGRAPECKIRLTADDIASYHCGLVHTPAGLWVVDLSGRGVVVNGERMRVSPLWHGTELWVGRFLIALHSQTPTPTTRTGESGSATAAALPPGTSEFLLPPTEVMAPLPPTEPMAALSSTPPEDEVPLGVAPQPDPLDGMSSSHIMADAFKLWTTTAEGMSNPFLVSGSGAYTPPLPESATAPARASSSGAPPSSLPDRPGPPEPIAPVASSSTRGEPHDAATEDLIVSLLRQIGDLHGNILAHFQQSLVLMVQLFGCLRRDQLPALRSELAHIQGLNDELLRLQAQLARCAAEASAITRTPAPSAPTPISTAPPPPPQDSTGLHEWVVERISTLQRERHERWQSLVGIFSGHSG